MGFSSPRQFRMTWLYLICLIGAAKAMSPSEACNFVTSRLIKESPTRCFKNFCAYGKFNVTLANATEPLACERAREIALSIMSGGSGEPKLKRRRLNDESLLTADQIESLFETVLVPAVEDVLHRKSPLSPAAVEAMSAVDRSLLTAASVWTRFKRDYAPWLQNSVLLDQFGSLVIKLANDEKRYMYSLEQRAVIHGTLLNFGFDLASFGYYGAFLTYQSLEITGMTREGRLPYRIPHEGEVRNTIPSLTVPESTWYLHASEEITKLREASELVSRGKRFVPDIRFLTELLASSFTQDGNHSGLWAILDHQLRTEICSTRRDIVVIVLIAAYKKVAPNDVLGRAAAAFLRLCRALEDLNSNTRDLVASITVSRSGKRDLFPEADLVLPGSAQDEMAVRRFFYDANWNGRPAGKVDVVLSLLEQLMSGVLPLPVMACIMGTQLFAPPFGKNGIVRERVDMGLSYELSWTTLGRLLAVCVRMGCKNLQSFPEAFVRLLIKDAPVTAEVPSSTAEALYLVNSGAMDVLGVLGFRVLSNSDLLSRFGLAEE